MTNEHVVAGRRGRDGASKPPETVDVRFSDGTWREGRVVGVDAYTDVAVAAVPNLPETATPLTVADEAPRPGRPVAVLGNPMGLDGTMTVGVVSGVNRSMPTTAGFAILDVVQTDAPINPGNSGGPLVALVVDAPAETGLRTATVRAGEEGVDIPVDGDVIVAVDDHPVRVHEDLMRYLLLEREPGDEVVLGVRRNGGPVDLSVILGERAPAERRDGADGIPIR